MNIKLGKILGIPVNIDVSWFVIFALIVYTLAVGYFPQANRHLAPWMNWLGGVIAALLLFGSVLLHELMHSVVAKRNGIGIGGITLFIFGGVSRMTDEPRTPQAELKMAIAGPATSIALAGIFYAMARLGGVAVFGVLGHEIVAYLALINLILGIFNLIPGFPLDGGRVFRAIMWGSTNSLEKATRYAAFAGQAFAWLFIALGFSAMLFGGFLGGLWFVFIGWFLNNAAHQSYQQLVLRRALSGIGVRQVMTTDVPRVEPSVSLQDFVHEYLLKYDYDAFPVASDHNCLAIITANEVRGIPREQWANTTVGQVAKPPEQKVVVGENEDAFDALLRMAEGNLRRLMVIEDCKLEGMVTQDSILNLVRTKMQLGV